MKEKQSIKGYRYVLQAFLMWGVLAIYWKSLKHIGEWELLSHRVIWSFIMLTIYLGITKKNQFKQIWRNKKNRYALLSTSILIGINWGVFIYAVNADKIVQAGLGYYITPLVNMFLGITILKEKLTKTKTLALTMVTGAILFLTLKVGEFPYISFILAFSFGFYGLVKKTIKVDNLPSLAFETTLLLPLAIAYQGFLWSNADSSLNHLDLQSIFLLIGTGIITILPLYWFTKGARKVNLTTVGFFQYVAPTIMLLIGIFVYNEPFESNHIIAFAIIWSAIAIYVYALIVEKRKK
ncbi:EamA family transporter RarD [Saccharicrinis sp. GN24d3]|uniref:EamA family transporter RarD n=1 Tax=Saccharicrinis sp. GN24d3 TaxID=3458416 RepID=UPI00403707C3